MKQMDIKRVKLNFFKKLSFWKQQERGIHTKQTAVPSPLLRDFIYLDLPLVSSFLEQLTGGIPQEKEVTRQTRGTGEAGMNMPFFQVKVEGTTGKGYRENQSIYWRRYSQLEKELRNTGKLIDLTQREVSLAAFQLNSLFLAQGYALLEPDWSDWQAGASVAKLVFEKLQQLNALEPAQQDKPNTFNMVPVLYGAQGEPMVKAREDIFSVLSLDELPEEPPERFRSLLKPSSIIIRQSLGCGDNAITLEGNAALEHFTPHRIGRYLLNSAKEDMYVLGFVQERDEDKRVFKFIPIAAYVKI